MPVNVVNRMTLKFKVAILYTVLFLLFVCVKSVSLSKSVRVDYLYLSCV